MINSIQQFQEKGIEKLSLLVENFAKQPQNHAEFIYGVTEAVIQLGLDIIGETFEDIDDALRESGFRKLNWHVVKKDQSCLLTSLGNVTYKKTLFKNKKTGERAYLTDRIMEIASHTRMTEDAEAKILSEAVESSYRKGGEQASLTESVSKQTVKNKIHKLEFPKADEIILEKKKVKRLYINADEDHVSAQFWQEKGDLTINEMGRKSNTLMPKLVYLYEDIQPENEDGKGSMRNRLINAHYFGGLRESEKNGELWKEVQDYIENHYDVDYIETVYLSGDGAKWIQAGCHYIVKSKFVLDRFHLQKYILKSISHISEGQQGMRDAIYDSISFEDKKELRKIYRELEEKAPTEAKKKEVESAKLYLINNWKGITIYNAYGHEIKGCSAESHVSHVYSSRLSSRPLGWSRQGADKMSMLRVYYYNKGNMLELVRNQPKEPLEKLEEKIYSCKEVINSERNKHGQIGKYLEAISGKINYPQVKKIASLKSHIWGL